MSKRKFELEETMVASFAAQTRSGDVMPPSSVEDIIRKTFHYAGKIAWQAMMDHGMPKSIADECMGYPESEIDQLPSRSQAVRIPKIAAANAECSQAIENRRQAFIAFDRASLELAMADRKLDDAKIKLNEAVKETREKWTALANKYLHGEGNPPSEDEINETFAMARMLARSVTNEQ